eukprot:CAMPEP_0201918862 /NCGR_PEP_ID=MMETSP0903-20130614/7904_1 /ASSEMBLY_ACC=CAM_ASM_000552 /TAXON_ID=420261 /ORGANISM="Thalassiosira antarctica, Strain CCMP982" /LENGTH=589 /DNA_ID=CAMNT_0048455257 /DNA_START=29 /DNA_END=1798 /DNA_ORIENTATION=+
MGYNNSRDNELKLVEEKKEDNGCGNRHDEIHDRQDQDQDKRPSKSDSNNCADANENEPSAMQQDLEHQPQHHQHHRNHHQGSHPSGISNFASTEMQTLQANLAAQQLLEQHSMAAQQHQQTQLMTGSLNSLQLGMPGTNAVIPAAFHPGIGIPPFAAPQTSTAASQIQQQLLAQQQAVAHAAALGNGAVSSSQAMAAGQIMAAGQLTPPLGVPSAALFAPRAPMMMGTSSPLFANAPQQAAMVAPLGMNPIVAAPLLAAHAGPLSTIGATAALAGPLATTAAIVPPTPTATPSHHPSPQMTIPHYIPPVPPTWGAQVPALSIQDRSLVPPIYNGINPNYPGAHLLHAHPPIFAVDNFLSPAECDFLIDASSDALGPAPVVGKGSGEVSASRTSSTCYLAREDLPEYLRKVSVLTGKPPEHCELPQVGRYMPSQRYLQHFDAFDLTNEDGRRFAANGGQRTVTVLVYLNDVPRGGATAFPNLNIEVQPRRGMALVFFPSTLDGLMDKMALHAALPAVDVKYVSQIWIRQGNYEGRPSKRLAEPMVAGLQEKREAILMGQLHHQQQMRRQHHHQQQQQQGYQQMGEYDTIL